MRRLSKVLRLAGSLLILATAIFGQSVTMSLTDAGNNILGGVYTSPYYATIGSSTNVPVICDDFVTESYLNAPFQADVTTFAQLVSGTNPLETPKWCTSGTSVVECSAAAKTPDLQGYATAAVLAAELMTMPNRTGTNATIAAEYSYALWDVFDPGLISLSGTTGVTTDKYNTDGTLTSDDIKAALNYLALAEAVAAGKTDLTQITINGRPIESLTIYTPSPIDATQEFLSVRMSEPSYPSVLVLDLFAVVGLLVFFRKRRSGMIS